MHNEDGGEYLVNPGGHVLDALAEYTDANVTRHVYVPNSPNTRDNNCVEHDQADHRERA